MTATPQPRPNLDGFFQPRRIALVGASERSTWSHMLMRRFREFDYRGTLYAVNREGKPAHGLPGFRSCKDLPEPVDIAFIFIPAGAVAGALEDAADAGITRAVILTSGFAEAGAEGIALQAQLVETARRRGVTFFGPNSLGFANMAEGLVASAIGTRTPAIRGGIGLVSQSGAVANEIVKFAHQQAIGMSFVGATGNEAMIGAADVIDYLVDDPATRVVVAYLESIPDPARLRAAAERALAARKPIVVLKVGSSAVSAAVAQAHTGSLVGDDRVFEAACRQLGIVRVRSIEEMMVTAALIEKTGPLDPPGIALVSVSGGACGMYADLADLNGVPIPQFMPETQDKLRAVLPAFASTINPLDITGSAVQDPALWSRTLPVVLADPGIGLVLSLMNVPGTADEKSTSVIHWPVIAQAYRDAGKLPMLLAQVIQPMDAVPLSVADESGLRDIVFGLDFGVRALGHLTRWSERVKAGAAPAARVETRAGETPRWRGERAALDHLARHGAPVVPGAIVASAAEALAEARAIGRPLALKIASPDIAHKTEVGGVRLNVDPADAGRVHDEIRAAVAKAAPDAAIDGILVSPMRTGGLELFVGVARDADWGPVIAVGLGGIWVEVLKDSAVRLLPIDRPIAIEMLESLRAAPLLKGYRGSPPADLDRVADAIVAIGEAALALGPDCAAFEVNPLWVNGGDVEALDALAVWPA